MVAISTKMEAVGARKFPPGFLHKESTKIEVGKDDVEALGTQACREQEARTLSISSHALAGHLIWLAGSASVRMFLLTTRHAYETDVDVSISKGNR